MGVEVSYPGPSSRLGVPAAHFFLLTLRVPEQVNESWTPGVGWRRSREVTVLAFWRLRPSFCSYRSPRQSCPSQYLGFPTLSHELGETALFPSLTPTSRCAIWVLCQVVKWDNHRTHLHFPFPRDHSPVLPEVQFLNIIL